MYSKLQFNIFDYLLSKKPNKTKIAEEKTSRFKEKQNIGYRQLRQLNKLFINEVFVTLRGPSKIYCSQDKIPLRCYNINGMRLMLQIHHLQHHNLNHKKKKNTILSQKTRQMSSLCHFKLDCGCFLHLYIFIYILTEFQYYSLFTEDMSLICL